MTEKTIAQLKEENKQLHEQLQKVQLEAENRELKERIYKIQLGGNQTTSTSLNSTELNRDILNNLMHTCLDFSDEEAVKRFNQALKYIFM